MSVAAVIPHEREDKIKRLAILAELSRRRLGSFTLWTKPEYVMGWFNKVLCNELDIFLAMVKDKMSPRLIIEAPPRHGKSELVSRRFPAFALGYDPNLSIIATSYAADLASAMNRDVQRIIDDESYRELFPWATLSGKNVRGDAEGRWQRNNDIFEIVNFDGVYKSAGVGGGITGMGGNILLCDDPIKDAEQAMSEVYRNKVWEWWNSTFYTRLAPGGGIVVVMTRWHEDDLVGRLKKQAADGGEAWRVVRFPAIAEVDEEYRYAGEALHPERYSKDQLERIKSAVGSRVWASLFQQNPTAAEGGIFKREWWKTHRTPEHTDLKDLCKQLGVNRIVKYWDTGFKDKKTSDRSACVVIGVTDTKYIVLDCWAGKLQFPQLRAKVESFYAKWKESELVPVLLMEDAASGQSIIQALQQETNLPIIGLPAKGGKENRAYAVTPLVEAGKVSLPRDAGWMSDFMEEMSVFPNGAHDDIVDAFDGALAYAARGGGNYGMLDYVQQQVRQMRDEIAERDKRKGVA